MGGRSSSFGGSGAGAGESSTSKMKNALKDFHAATKDSEKQLTSIRRQFDKAYDKFSRIKNPTQSQRDRMNGLTQRVTNAEKNYKSNYQAEVNFKNKYHL